jgi:hypothetical protein
MMISRSFENNSRLSIRLPFMVRDRIAEAAMAACVLVRSVSSHEVADIVIVAPQRTFNGKYCSLYRAIEAQSNRCNLQSI